MNSQLELAKQLHYISIAYRKYKVCDFTNWFFTITGVVSALGAICGCVVLAVCMGDTKFIALSASSKISLETLHYDNSTLNYYNYDQTTQYFNSINRILTWLWNSYIVIITTTFYSLFSWLMVDYSESKVKKYKSMYSF